MKKIYLSALVLGMTSLVGYAQNLGQTIHKFDNSKLSNVAPAVTQPNYSVKALGTEIWRDEFNDGSNWTTSFETAPVGGTIPAGFGWNIGTTEATWWTAFQTGISSTSGGGFAEVNNGDYFNDTQETGVTYYMTSNPLDIVTLSGGSDDVVLSFEQFGAKFNDAQTLEISTDGTTFTEIFTNANKTAFVGNNPSAVFANPEKVTINISPFIDGAANAVVLRFKWTSAFASQTDLDAWTTFGWFIDDVAIETVADNDLTVTEPTWGSEGIFYYQLPLTQAAPIDFSAIVTNNGSATQTNTMLNVNIAGAGTYTASSTPQDFAFLETDTLRVAPFTPTAMGVHNLTWDVSQDQTEDYPIDNAIPNVDFEVTEFIYAVDKGTQDASYNNQGDPFIIGNLYDIWADQDAHSINVFIDANSEVGTTIQATIYEFDGSQTTFSAAIANQVGFSAYYDIQSSDLGQMITLPLSAPASLTNSVLTYFVAIESQGTLGSDDGPIVGTAGPNQLGVCYQNPDGANWYIMNGTPMIRLNFENTSSLTENEMVSNLNVYPNPATENVSVGYELANATDVTINVTDIAGKTVATSSVANQAAGSNATTFNTNAFNSGVYFVNISTEAGVITQKFIKK